MNEKIKVKNFILIIIFAVVFSLVVQDGIRLVIQKFLEIPDGYIGLAQWGDTFFLRIFASLIGTATSTFVIGTFLKKKVGLAAIIATLPTVIFWLGVLTIFWLGALMYGATQEYLSENTKPMLFVPIILVILSPIVGYFSAKWGQNYSSNFQRQKSILNIKWYHWLWIFPFYLNKVIAVPLFTLILLWKIDVQSTFKESLYFALIFDFGNTISRIIVLFMLIGLFASIKHAYSLLSEEETTAKINWKNGIIIFCHV